MCDAGNVRNGTLAIGGAIAFVTPDEGFQIVYLHARQDIVDGYVAEVGIAQFPRLGQGGLNREGLLKLDGSGRAGCVQNITGQRQLSQTKPTPKDVPCYDQSGCVYWLSWPANGMLPCLLR